jgi:pantetheine-phosphate adenylyltransferase
MATQNRIAVFPGSFDPFTRGHEDVVRRALLLFDKVIVGVGHNPKKERYFPVEKIEAHIRDTFAGEDKVEVIRYDNLTAEFAHQQGAKFLLRGLRNTTDFEYENGIAQANRSVYPDLETVFLITSPSLAYISSSIVRELHRFGRNVDAFVPYPL